jgi:hypothetical protein
MRDLAERLIAHEMQGNKSSKSPMAFLVNERLRSHLTALLGVVGFRALLSRALVLASAEVSWLRAVQVKTDGSLEGLGELEVRVSRDTFLDSCVVLLAQFLGLMVTFIGEELTLRLVQDLSPKLPLNDFYFGKGDKK